MLKNVILKIMQKNGLELILVANQTQLLKNMNILLINILFHTSELLNYLTLKKWIFNNYKVI